MVLKAIYINLEDAVSRAASLEESWKKFGGFTELIRFPGIRGDSRKSKLSPSELGCFLSHAAVIRSLNRDCLSLILEDDVLITEQFSRYLVSFAEQIVPNCDIWFLNGGVSFYSIEHILGLLKLKRELGNIRASGFANFRVISGAIGYTHSASAYIINPSSIPKILGLLAEAESGEYQYPIDIVYKNWMRSGEINGQVIFPFLTGIDWRHSSQIASDRNSSVDTVLHDALGNIFVAGAETAAIRLDMLTQTNTESFDEDAYLISKILYKKFAIYG